MKLDVLETDRSCGPCTACCTELPLSAGVVSPQAKPAGAPCPRLCADGCSIYADRPDVCTRFQCAWFRFHDWPSTWRPLESGLLCLWEYLDDHTPMAAAYELRHGAFQSATGRQIVDRLTHSSLAVALIDFDGQRRLIAAPNPLLSTLDDTTETVLATAVPAD